jgi:ABC-2 type transport system permease protein
MLWYKAWLETRSRFFASLAGTVALCSYFVQHGDREALLDTKLAYYYFVLQGGHNTLCMMWVLAVTLLMMGGLLREKAVGAASHTLSLPVSRARLMGARIGMGFAEAVALAIVPWCAMFLIGALAGRTHDFQQAGFHLVLLIGGGMLFFAVALLVSSLVEGEYMAPIVSFGITLILSAVLADGPLRAYSPMQFITGAEYLDRHTGLLTPPIPWLHLAGSIVMSALLVGISVRMVHRQEF